MGSAATAELQRVTAENARVNAENARVQEWNELSTNVTTATSSANEAAGQANIAAQGAIGAANAANDATTRANNTITGITQNANQIFAQAGQATINANAAAQSATDAATLATTKAELADTAAQNADTATTAANAAATTATTAAEQADAAREAIQSDLAAKADADGYYQLLTAGLADTLMSGDTEVVQFAQRVSDHDGMASIQSIRGNTIADNGELVSVNIEGIQSAGVTRTIPVSMYFPDGLRSAGTVYDELDFVRHKAVTRMGAVDLGTLTWTYADGRFGTTYAGIKRGETTASAGNVICVDYTSVANIETADDKSIAANVRRYGNNKVYIKDSAYTDTATFTQAMSGKMLYYELATPTETDLPEYLQTTYPVEIGGTESIVIPTGENSAPPTMAIVYGYTADGVRDESQSIVAPVERGVASTNYAVGSYFVMGGILYRVTTAIATGETINPGTNCTATTVMAEIIRLTA